MNHNFSPVRQKHSEFCPVLTGLPNLLSSSNSHTVPSLCMWRKTGIRIRFRRDFCRHLLGNCSASTVPHELSNLPATLNSAWNPYQTETSSCSFKQNPVPCHNKLQLIFSLPLTPDRHVGQQPCSLQFKCFWIQGQLDPNDASKVTEKVNGTTGEKFRKAQILFCSQTTANLNALIKSEFSWVI